ncbi:DUF6966 domain-containing protein [Pseudomonas capsici]|uniref:DUF6966 domain-containing protein n=1 Tax=Pseudomonas capsici TaxID=2810614 RepID=A0ABT3BVS0_9PSED|nr:hypothetical protein [Pseudomonas capsici]MBN6716539.1 hypothetical protein [Pseudomonas capsici]MBN6721384.1 hypothetical protein [Pseudomonas capsici]MBN6726467.1 hypothetical protein [Pseudomonas capsici]MCV4265587.1 hypothetical protein [Pseudomonas capsici]MCV4268140.1 hypothetical protein [Pseudomonas capsici]
MNKYERVLVILEEMATLLDMAGISDWAEAIRRAGSNDESEASILYNTVLRMYGGSGSLNDIVLYFGGKVLVRENDKFDELRSELYKLCR